MGEEESAVSESNVGYRPDNTIGPETSEEDLMQRNHRIAMGLSSLFVPSQRGFGVRYIDSEGERRRVISELTTLGIEGGWLDPATDDEKVTLGNLIRSYPALHELSATALPEVTTTNPEQADFVSWAKKAQERARSEVRMFQRAIRFNQNPTWRDEKEGESNWSTVNGMQQSSRQIRREYEKKMTAVLKKEETRKLLKPLVDWAFRGLR